MKKYSIYSLFIIFALFVYSCKDDQSSLVNEDGLTKEIVNLVPDSILTEMKSMGMPIYGGENPPNIENSYVASPFVLKASNRESDEIGHTYSDYYVKFHNQDNKSLKINMDYQNGQEKGTGMGSYIVGSDDKFSVFIEVNATENEDSKAKLVHVISGKWTSDGIKNLYFANFMLDNYGNTSGYWIENGDGRVIYDSDGFSPITDLFKSALIMKAETGAASSK